MSGIDNLVSHIEKNQSQKDGIISGAEWQLVAKVLGESSREEGETFSKQDIRKLDKEQQQQAKKDNAVEKNNKEYNNSLKKAQEVLNNPEYVKQLLHMCEVQAKLIKNGADVVYYESFLNSIPVGGLKDDDTVKRIQDLLDEKGKVSASKESSSIVEPSNDTGNTSESLQKKLEKVDSYDLGLFKSTIESLQSGKVSIDQLDPLNKITQIIKEIAQFDPAIALKQIDTFLDNKISSLSEPLKTEFKNKAQEFHPLLDSLLQRKDILQKFTDIVDNNIKGLSYQSLLEAAKNKNTLNSPEAIKAINNLFHIDEELFNQLRADFNDPQKKEQVELIVKQYIILSNPNIPLDGTSFVLKDVTLDDGKTKKTSFMLLNQAKEPVKIKIGGKDEIVSPYFGKEGSGNALTLKECTANTWFSDALGVQNGSISMNPELTGLMKQTIDTKAGPKSLSELANSLLDNPLLKELRKLLLMFNSEVSGDGKAAVQLNYLNAVDAMKSVWNTERSKPQYSDYKDKDSKWLGEQIKKYPFSLKDDPTDDVAKLSQDAPGSEKHFFASILTPEEQIAYILDPVERKTYQEGGNKQTINLKMFKESNGAVQILDKPDASNSKKPDGKLPIEGIAQGKEFKNGVSYPELSIDGKSPGKVELKGKDTDTPYLIVDGQAIALIKDKEKDTYEGELSTVDGDNRFYIKKLTFDKDLKNITIISEEAKGINNANNKEEYSQNFYQGGKYNLDYILKNPGGGNIGFLAFHSSQIFPKDGDKVKNIYDTITSTLSTQLPDVQKIFVDLQTSLQDFLINKKDSYTKEDLKVIIDKTKQDLLAIKGSGSTSILQAQVDAWYSQFDFGASVDKPSTQKKPV